VSEIDFDSISLRSVAPEDRDFLLELYQSSRGDDLRRLGWSENEIGHFLEKQYEAHRTFEQRDYAQAVGAVILVSHQRVGRLLVDYAPDEIRCLDISLLPAWRNQGLGTYLIRRLQKESAERQQPLRLQVIRFNRAVNLFERLGFATASETGTHFQMEWKQPKSEAQP
jgi:ribosomal protein S18 acetylase RimI-like enzyme